MNNERELISVVVASYNTQSEYLKEMIDSILNQTYKNLELIIVDDGSINPVKNVVKEYNDNRIKLITNDTNIGVTKSRNKALEAAKGEYIAIMDSDDISDRDRLKKQIEYLNNNKKVDLVSCQMKFISDDGRKNPYIKIPKNRKKYQTWLFWDNSIPFPHGPAMIRSSFIKNNNIKYDERYKRALDYKLWVDCSKYGEFHIINEYLYGYRVHENQISQKGKYDQEYFSKRICLDQLENLNINATEDDEIVHIALRAAENYNNPKKLLDWKLKLEKSNNKIEYYNKFYFKQELQYRYFKACYKNYIIFKNKKYLKYLIKSCNMYVINRSFCSVLKNKMSKNKSRVLKV